jgi:hypothetical protein
MRSFGTCKLGNENKSVGSKDKKQWIWLALDVET